MSKFETDFTIYRRLVIWLATAVAAVLLMAATVVGARLSAGDGLEDAVKASSAFTFRHLRGPAFGIDSWGPMFAAHYRVIHRPDEPVYSNVLSGDNCKFQYPTTALLILDLLPPRRSTEFSCTEHSPERTIIEQGGWAPKKWLDQASRISVLATLGVIAFMMHTALVKYGSLPAAMGGNQPQPRSRWILPTALTGAVFVLGLTFYPLVWGYEIGQIQVFLNLFIALALLAYLKGAGGVAGVLIGLCCLVKPQYGVFILWGLLRRDWRFAGALVAVVVSGIAAAIYRYGWAVQLEYLAFLRGLARHGEVFWPNQTVNGILNRFLSIGDPLQWADSSFPIAVPPEYLDPRDEAFPWAATGFPHYHPLVYWTTMATSVAILVAALVPLRHGAEPMRRALDFGLLFVSTTVAAPIAWQHHYGAFIAVFGLAAVYLACKRYRTSSAVALGIGFLLMTSTFLRPDLVFQNRWLGLLGATVWAGAVVLFLFLAWLLHRPEAVGVAAGAQGDQRASGNSTGHLEGNMRSRICA